MSELSNNTFTLKFQLNFALSGSGLVDAFTGSTTLTDHQGLELYFEVRRTYFALLESPQNFFNSIY